MLLRKTARFWKTGLMIISFALILFVSGCSDKDQNISNSQNTETEIQGGYEGIPEKDEILDVSLKIYEEFSKNGKLEDLKTVRSISVTPTVLSARLCPTEKTHASRTEERLPFPSHGAEAPCLQSLPFSLPK